MFGRVWCGLCPDLTKFCSASIEVGPKSTKLGQTFLESTEIARNQPNLAELDKMWLELGQTWSDVGQLRPNDSVKFDPNSAQLDRTWPGSTKLGPRSTNLGPEADSNCIIKKEQHGNELQPNMYHVILYPLQHLKRELRRMVN